MVKNHLKTITLLGAAALSLGIGAFLYKNSLKDENPTYKYAISKGLDQNAAKTLEGKLNLGKNEEEFIDIISGYPKNLQRICVNSDILDNGHVSREELNNTKKADINGIVNPEEDYAIIGNGSGDDDPDLYSAKNMEYSMKNILNFYELLKKKGVSDENITLLLYNPLGINLDNNIKIDGISNKKNFTIAMRDLKADSNDAVYLVYSNPGPNPDYTFNYDKGYIDFIDGKLRDFDIQVSSKIKYGKAIIIGNNNKLLSDLANFNIGNLGEKAEYLSKKILAISSPDTPRIRNETFITDIIERYLKNPQDSIKELIKDYNKNLDGADQARIYYYNEDGIKRSPEECDWYKKPLF